ncbi:MAG: CBS domain-containing protein [Saprospiraceae bacterium]|jgi:acetoin utilization protein AcuB|nr:CBS domain-containing protein [Saprospiraceae bacterium]MBK6480517.1 CBS domain-containing protein [Saprospiraceae bacterium]MBK6817114.1 CBS domain-containing protein [Saprospiraceae bacterium]MBK7371668.1 CBS domain-containing protein [Saprospiraceae bacterium]MBK7435859.1 CBS domain-containing protein [Saprospiraceae bacterium]
MDLKASVSTLMKKELITVSEEDSLERIKEIFNLYDFHHIPVVQYKKLIGLISLSDISFLIDPSVIELGSLEAAVFDTTWIKAKNVMRTRLGKLEPDDRIEVAIDIFLNNNFHCLPVVKGDELVGMVTPVDILRALV